MAVFSRGGAHLARALGGKLGRQALGHLGV